MNRDGVISEGGTENMCFRSEKNFVSVTRCQTHIFFILCHLGCTSPNLNRPRLTQKPHTRTQFSLPLYHCLVSFLCNRHDHLSPQHRPLSGFGSRWYLHVLCQLCDLTARVLARRQCLQRWQWKHDDRGRSVPASDVSIGLPFQQQAR